MYPKKACGPGSQCGGQIIVYFLDVCAESIQDPTHGRHVEKVRLGGPHDVLQ